MESLFTKYHLKDKLPLLRSMIKNLNLSSCGLILSWISEWSRKQYYEALSKIRCSRTAKNKKIKKPESSHCEESESFNPPAINLKGSIVLLNRTTIYRYLNKELQEYYQLAFTEGLD